MISVIIVNHNGEAYLSRCLESLEGSGVEILLVDNASRDGSLSLVRERFQGTVILPQDRNLGFAAANNLAAEHANRRVSRTLANGTIVEIGSFQGRSTIVLASAAPSGVEIIAIDPHAGNDRGPQEQGGGGGQGGAGGQAAAGRGKSRDLHLPRRRP